MSTRSALPLEDAALRGDTLRVVLDYLLRSGKRGSTLTPAELRTKQAVWQWFSSLAPGEIERVSGNFAL
jgi:hypothetical protein